MTRFETCGWSFPTADEWPDEDVVAVGADLEQDTLLYAYAHGMFPMHIDRARQRLGWWSPVQRGIIPLDGLHVSRSTRRSARNYAVTFNTAFTEVMTLCATTHRDGHWITEEFVAAFTRLHDSGHAMSVEVRDDSGSIVGGTYGVRIDRFFAGESMFHLRTDASKVALVHLFERLRDEGCSLFDTQWCTPHLASLGCTEVPRARYLHLLHRAID